MHTTLPGRCGRGHDEAHVTVHCGARWGGSEPDLSSGVPDTRVARRGRGVRTRGRRPGPMRPVDLRAGSRVEQLEQELVRGPVGVLARPPGTRARQHLPGRPLDEPARRVLRATRERSPRGGSAWRIIAPTPTLADSCSTRFSATRLRTVGFSSVWLRARVQLSVFSACRSTQIADASRVRRRPVRGRPWSIQASPFHRAPRRLHVTREGDPAPTCDRSRGRSVGRIHGAADAQPYG